MWQDIIFMIGNAVFFLSLIPTVIENRKLKRCDIPFKTSISTGGVLYIFTIAFFTLTLWYAGMMAFLVALIWTFIARQKYVYVTKKRERRGGIAMDTTWSCHICGEKRPDEKISVHSRPLIVNGINLGKENIRYCNDRSACVEGAKNYSHIKTTNCFIDGH